MQRAEQAVQPADQRRGERLQAEHRHGPLESCVCGEQHARHAAGEGREAPGERVDAVQADAALRGQQRVLPRRAHADAPAREAQEREQEAIGGDGGQHERKADAGNARAVADVDRGVGEAEHRQRMARLRAEGEDHPAAQQNPQRDRRQHRGEHRFAGHAPHQRQVNQHAHGDSQRAGRGDRDERMAREQSPRSPKARRRRASSARRARATARG